jgi:elongation factor Ts
MAEITAAMVKSLRETSGAGMLDCKKALVETNGNMEDAIDWLRKKGLASAAKKASRIAAEGLVSVFVDGNAGAVAKNDIFQDYVENAAKAAMAVKGDVEALKSFVCPVTGKEMGTILTDMIAKIGENMNLRRSAYISAENGVVCSYIHNSVRANLGKIGVLVALEGTADKAKMQELGKHIAMHIAATNPIAMTVAEVPAENVAREKAIFSEQALASGKPANIVEKMVEGRIRKYYEEVVLEEQAYIMDPDKKVKAVVEEFAKENNAAVKLSGFVCFKLGEGLQKKEEDFASEVAAQLGKSA